MSHESYGKGWMVDPPDIRDLCPTSTKIENLFKNRQMESKNIPAEITPPSIDNRKYCTPIRNQGQLGSCVAFASVAMYEYLEMKTKNKYLEGSELFLYKMARYVMQVHGDGNGSGDTGAYIRSGVGAMALFGVPPEASWPYIISKFDENPPVAASIIGQSFQALNYLRLDPYTGQLQNLKLIKDWLSKGFPVQFGFSCYQSALNQANVNGHIPYPSTNDMRTGGHSVLAVGYDDNLNIANADSGKTTTGAILFRNSWGANWGSKGYGYIPYEYILQELADDFWTVISLEFLDLKVFDW